MLDLKEEENGLLLIIKELFERASDEDPEKDFHNKIQLMASILHMAYQIDDLLGQEVHNLNIFDSNGGDRFSIDYDELRDFLRKRGIQPQKLVTQDSQEELINPEYLDKLTHH